MRGRLRVPGDKSIAHRALMLAALADGDSVLRGIPPSGDVSATADCLRALGVSLPPLEHTIAVRGAGVGGLAEPHGPLDCRNSGTTVRLLAGVAAAHSSTTVFTGDPSLSRRPMDRVAAPLRAMGASIRLNAGGLLPMAVEGGVLRPLRWRTDVASAQVKSAILLAGLCGGVEVEIAEPSLSRDHTERLLLAMGATLEIGDARVRFSPVDRLRPLDLDVPADPSSAAFPLALGLLAAQSDLALPDVLLNPTRTGYLEVLRRMGAKIEVRERCEAGGDTVGTLVPQPSRLIGTVITPGEIPRLLDEVPLLACVAARAEGETRITGAGALRVKESDRLAVTAANLRRLSVWVEELPDGLVVRGTDAPLTGLVQTAGDHRIAMAFAVLGAISGNTITVDDPACVAVSYPDFWSDLRRITGGTS